MNIKALKMILLTFLGVFALACSVSDEETTALEETLPLEDTTSIEETTPSNEISPFDIASIYDETSASRAEVMMQAYFEENRGWCLDAPSSISGIAGLHTHTCYLYRNDGADGVAHDQAFIVELIEEQGIFYLVDYDLCLTMFEAEEGAFVSLEACGGALSHLQKMNMSEDGLVSSAIAPELCMTTGDYTTPGGGGNPMHIIRKLTFEACDDSNRAYQAWELRAEWPGLADESLITEVRSFPSLAAGNGAGG